MPDTRFWIMTRDGEPVDAGRFDPVYSWSRPDAAKLEPGDTIAVYDRTPMLDEYDVKAIATKATADRIAALRAELDELDPPVVATAEPPTSPSV